ncbi:MauE/DoxX family redox-associated membrane protein [Streptosporangium amethystogenes]|uniref:MauE/DoxX family redox-associated membrane protein n=1 Tax=Streptosporangium amethystogenes TaxID=2002 RepID=UPI0037B1785C
MGLIDFLIHVAKFTVATVFLVAAMGKAVPANSFRLFRISLRSYGLTDSHIASAAAIGLIALESMLAVTLSVDSLGLTREAFVLTALSLSLFTLLAGHAHKETSGLRCNCFGPRGREFGLFHIVRNAGLIVVSILCAFYLYRHDTLPNLHTGDEYLLAITLGISVGISMLLPDLGSPHLDPKVQ